MNDLQLYSKIAALPSELKKEVSDFVDFLKLKIKNDKLPKARKPGIAKGFFKMSVDFDEPMEDFKEYM